MADFPLKVLVADDDPDVQMGITDILETEGFTVLTASDGQEAVEVAIAEHPDLILCDIIMPRVSGFEMLQRLKQEPHLATVPFIFLTARAEKDSLRLGMDLGADDYLTKPIDRRELLRAILARLEKHRFLQEESDSKLNILRRNIALSLPHELRTPLNGILGFADILIEEAETLTPTEVREIGKDLRTCGNRLHRLIQNFLIYAEMEAGVTQPPHPSTLTPIKELTTRVALKCARQANREADLRLELNEGTVPVPSPRWQKIVEELIDNALRYSVAGQPVLVKSSWHDHTLVVEIRDCGRGMTAEQIRNLGAYMQFDRRIYEQQGTGLGLTVAKRLAEFYGGVFTIESAPLTGTTIYLHFRS
ncbi:MAG: response regulator [Pseudanabaenaceae cyanobacterium]